MASLQRTSTVPFVSAHFRSLFRIRRKSTIHKGRVADVSAYRPLLAFRTQEIIDILERLLGMSVLCGIFKNVDCTNTKYSAEICGDVMENCLIPTTPSRSTVARTDGCSGKSGPRDQVALYYYYTSPCIGALLTAHFYPWMDGAILLATRRSR